MIVGQVDNVDNLRAAWQSAQNCAVNNRAQDTILPHKPNRPGSFTFMYTSTHDENAPDV